MFFVESPFVRFKAQILQTILHSQHSRVNFSTPRPRWKMFELPKPTGPNSNFKNIATTLRLSSRISCAPLTSGKFSAQEGGGRTRKCLFANQMQGKSKYHFASRLLSDTEQKGKQFTIGLDPVKRGKHTFRFASP